MQERPDVEALAAAFREAHAAGLPVEPAAVFHDLDAMRARVRRLVAAFPEGTLHAVAVKANPLLGVLRALVEEGCGLECASIEEVELALAAGCPADRVVYDAPAKTPSDLARALHLGVRVHADHLDELARIAAQGGGSVGIRINPLVGAGRIEMTSVAAIPGRFGVPIDQADAVVEAFRRHPWLDGLHVHVGSQGCPLDLLLAGLERVEDVRRRIDGAFGAGRVRVMDVGGGLPVAYRDDQPFPSMEAYAAEVRSRVAPGARLVTEFGRWVQVPVGFAVSRVEYARREGPVGTAVIHLGADMLLRDAYLPQIWSHEIAVLDHEGHVREGAREPWTVVGPLCFAGDAIARERQLAPIRAGDRLLIRDVGGYTMGMWSRHCSRGMPVVLARDGGAWRVLRPAETPADLVRFWGP